MSVKKIKRPYRSSDASRRLVNDLIQELEAAPADNVLTEPLIVEDYVGNTDRFSVTVIWAKWAGVDPAERSRVVMDSYEHSPTRSEDLLKINAVLGLTAEEAESLGIKVA